ncbi:hypothetical protein B0A48_02230 [Cryoendolithus antarcticus]|uniref:BZIP domain-containing protein n=1 Tax=Cryoendolithus antarcticus TaxID=1507870 RepID=A0A1V8TN09_9PEZI|nr:hypothetical protein B0A48_02230 [Cryoendolithus antarcticus]
MSSQVMGGPLPSMQLPPMLQGSREFVDDQLPPPPASRTSVLPSLLNPAPGEGAVPSRRRKFDQLDSPPMSEAALPPILNRPQTMRSPVPSRRPSVPDFRGNIRQDRSSATQGSPKRIVTHSLMTSNPPTGTISAQESPFPNSPRTRSNTYSSVTSAGLGSAPRPSYGSIAPAPSQPGSRRTSGGHGRRHRALSSSTSPSTTYANVDRTERISPATQYPQMPPTYHHAQDLNMGGANASTAYQGSTHDERASQMGIPISSTAGQNVYQMMTLETTSGTVQLPVDVQAASRVADEKRRRNAGASARFRQRRKEKERESSTTISKLEQRLKALTDDSDFYKRERDFFAGILMQLPGAERHFPRPQSPRHRRSSSIFAPDSVSGSGGYVSGPEQMRPNSPTRGRNVRRRTSTISLPPLPASMAAPISAGPPFTPHSFGQYTGMTQPSQYSPGPGTFPSPMTRVSLPGAASLMASLQPQQQQQQQGYPQKLQQQSRMQPVHGMQQPQNPGQQYQGTQQHQGQQPSSFGQQHQPQQQLLSLSHSLAPNPPPESDNSSYNPYPRQP